MNLIYNASDCLAHKHVALNVRRRNWLNVARLYALT